MRKEGMRKTAGGGISGVSKQKKTKMYYTEFSWLTGLLRIDCSHYRPLLLPLPFSLPKPSWSRNIVMCASSHSPRHVPACFLCIHVERQVQAAVSTWATIRRGGKQTGRKFSRNRTSLSRKTEDCLRSGWPLIIGTSPPLLLVLLLLKPKHTCAYLAQ